VEYKGYTISELLDMTVGLHSIRRRIPAD